MEQPKSVTESCGELLESINAYWHKDVTVIEKVAYTGIAAVPLGIYAVATAIADKAKDALPKTSE